MLNASVSLKNSGFLICPKDMRNPHPNAKGSFSRTFGMTRLPLPAAACFPAAGGYRTDEPAPSAGPQGVIATFSTPSR